VQIDRVPATGTANNTSRGQFGHTGSRNNRRRHVVPRTVIQNQLVLARIILGKSATRLQHATLVVPAVLLPESASLQRIAITVLDVLRASSALHSRIRILIRQVRVLGAAEELEQTKRARRRITGSRIPRRLLAHNPINRTPIRLLIPTVLSERLTNLILNRPTATLYNVRH